MSLDLFKERLAEARKEKGFTQAELARRLGVTAQAVSKWERGNAYPDMELLDGIFRVLDCSPDYLFQYERGTKSYVTQDNLQYRSQIEAALLKDALVLVLDDCTRALDIETESKIFKNLDTFFTGKTIVMTTHRAMALKDFDEIIYMENGRIAERGTFDELMKADGHYAAIYKQQMDKEVYAVEQKQIF